jgi:ketosteroid isomerase-like protein
MTDHVDQIREAFHAQATGDLEPARRLFAPAAVLNLPAFIPLSDPTGFDGMVALIVEMMGRCDGGFASTFIDAIGDGEIVTTVNRVDATRKGRAISYNTVWTFRFEDGLVSEAWLHPSLAGEEIARFYDFDGGLTS